MKAWYFATNDNKLQYGDGRQIIIGETHTVDCVPKCCVRGLHGSIRLIDALKYASGNMIYRVDINGDIDIQSDKICGTSRTYLAGFDGLQLLREFTQKQAILNIELIKPYCSVRDYDLIIDYLNTCDEGIRAAVSGATARAARAASCAADGGAIAAASYSAAYAARASDATHAAYASYAAGAAYAAGGVDACAAYASHAYDDDSDEMLKQMVNTHLKTLGYEE